MIQQLVTYYPDTYIIKTYKEYFNNELVVSQTFDIQGQLTYNKDSNNETHYLNGKPHGKHIGLLIQGHKEIINYKMGQWHGRYELYFPNGQPSLIRNYLNGLPHGLSQEYHTNGQMIHEINFKKNIYHGFVKQWDEQGDPIKHLYYVDGKRVETPQDILYTSKKLHTV